MAVYHIIKKQLSAVTNMKRKKILTFFSHEKLSFRQLVVSGPKVPSKILCILPICCVQLVVLPWCDAPWTSIICFSGTETSVSKHYQRRMVDVYLPQ